MTTKRTRIVRDEGSTQAPIVLIGEAPGKHEDQIGRPFVGPAGKLLTKWWQKAGVSRQDCYITNVCPRRPNERNDISVVHPLEMQAYTERLHDTIATLDDPHVLVPTGNTALRALLGFEGITRHRGYFYTYTDRRGRELKVIPTIHPAASLYGQSDQETAEGKKGRRSWAVRCIKDWQRIAEEARHPELLLPERKQYVRPTLDDVRWLHAQVLKLPKDAILVFDVETPRNKVETVIGETKTGRPKVAKTWGDPFLACIGFAYDPSWAMCIPTTQAYWGSAAKLMQVREMIREMLTCRAAKGTQNGLFDWFICWLFLDVWPINWRWDSLPLHHLQDPIEEHSLEFQASTVIRTSYWKDEAKDADESTQIAARNIEQFWAYNAKDCHHTLEIIQQHMKALGPDGLARYRQFYQQKFNPLLDIMVRGIRVNDTLRRKRLAQLTAEQITLRAALTDLAGEDLYAEKAISPVRLQRFLYETLGLPKQTKRDHKKGTVRVSTDVLALRKLQLKHPEKCGGAVQLILDSRRAQKKMEFYDDNLLDPDGYTRCMYGWTETLRLKSRDNPMRRGRNHQNFDRQCRDHLIPDEGHVWLECDLSQAESRVCYVMTGDDKLIALARKMPWEFDQHKYNASIIFGCPITEVTGELRQIGKIGVHAAQRDMKGATLSDTLLKELGIVRTADECQAMIETYFAGGHQPIRDVYFREVRHRIIHDRKLTNSWGFTIYLDEEPLNDNLYRRGYSFYMQSEVGMLTNEWGLDPTWHWMMKERLRSRITLQAHDALHFSADPEEVYPIMCQVRSTLERPRTYWGTELLIPVEWKIGRSAAKGGIEFKQFPTQEEVRKALATLGYA